MVGEQGSPRWQPIHRLAVVDVVIDSDADQTVVPTAVLTLVPERTAD